MEGMKFSTAAEGAKLNHGGSVLGECKLVDVPTVAEWLQVSPQWVYRHWRKLGGKKAGAHIRFIEKEIVERFKEGLN
ncbi:MAG: hypothetical protein CVU60_08075 [Deltaproteobacteria bacterium HGW-Deltaproteobacteria-18]|jgi:hypothetical protein|nr:MAG: hypothetical protein CVU60_08075 [Deltaproteobacteria bacterium HGW-Deltaproteobacteria-18]